MTSSVEEIQQTFRGIFAPIGLLEVQDGFNVRSDATPDEQLQKLIREHGVLRPLHVRNNPKKPGHYIIIDGERRFRAATMVGKEEVPIIPEGEMDDNSALVMSVVANSGSKTLTTKEEAEAFKRLSDAKIALNEIAKLMGCSKRKVEETLRALNSEDEDLAKGVATDEPGEKIPPRAAARAATLPLKERKEVAKKLKGKSVEEGVKLVREVEKGAGIKRRGRKASDYPWAKDAKHRAEILEKAAKSMLKEGVNRRADAHLEIISCLKGKTEPGELYEKILAEVKEEKPKVEKKAVKKGRKKKA